MKENENQEILYFPMLLGSIGSAVLLLVSLMYMQEQQDTAYLGIFGFLLTTAYINYLEEKAGISNKLIWIKAILSMIIFFSCGYFFLL